MHTSEQSTMVNQHDALKTHFVCVHGISACSCRFVGIFCCCVCSCVIMKKVGFQVSSRMQPNDNLYFASVILNQSRYSAQNLTHDWRNHWGLPRILLSAPQTCHFAINKKMFVNPNFSLLWKIMIIIWSESKTIFHKFFLENRNKKQLQRE